jgi:hypothetical protein
MVRAFFDVVRTEDGMEIFYKGKRKRRPVHSVPREELGTVVGEYPYASCPEEALILDSHKSDKLPKKVRRKLKSVFEGDYPGEYIVLRNVFDLQGPTNSTDGRRVSTDSEWGYVLISREKIPRTSENTRGYAFINRGDSDI